MIRQLGAALFVLTVTAATLPSAATEQPTLAVLPFANLSGDPAQDWLSNVVTDNTVKTLAKVGDLFVVTGGSPAHRTSLRPGSPKSWTCVTCCKAAWSSPASGSI